MSLKSKKKDKQIKCIRMKHWAYSLIRNLNESYDLKGKKNNLTYICDMMEAVGCEQSLSRWFE